MRDRSLSSIEMTVLGLAWLRGPCSIYAIMKELSNSGSTYHKSRAGTAYSIAHRLIESGMLSVSESGDEREGHVSVSETGVSAIQEWLTPPLPMADVAHSADLIRLRFFFLGAVNQETRLAMIDSALKSLRQLLLEYERLVFENEAIGDYFGGLATLSTLFEARARIQWLTLVRKWVETPVKGTNWAEEMLHEVRETEPDGAKIQG